jgi:hypothetical protein
MGAKGSSLAERSGGKTISNFTAATIDGQQVSLGQYAKKVRRKLSCDAYSVTLHPPTAPLFCALSFVLCFVTVLLFLQVTLIVNVASK